MRIGIAGPVSLNPFGHLLPECAKQFQAGLYTFPLTGDLVRELHQRGHELVVFGSNTRVEETLEITGERIKVLITPRREKRAPYDFYRLERRYLADAMRNAACDIVHAHWTYEFAAAAQDSGVTCLITAHDSPLAILRYFLPTRYGLNWAFRVALGARVIQRASWMTTVSEYAREHIQRTLHPHAPIAVVHNGVAETLFESGSRRISTRTEIGRPFTVATVLEGFERRKNGTAALQAFAQLRERMKGARLLMFGTGYGTGENAETWAKHHRAAQGVEFAGKVPQTRMFERLAAEADVLLHPSKEESFGMSICEAMALGIPVIAGRDSGAVPSLLANGEAGVLVDICRPAEIAATLIELAGDLGNRLRLAERGWQRARKYFTLERMVEGYIQTYHQVLSKQKEIEASGKATKIL